MPEKAPFPARITTACGLVIRDRSADDQAAQAPGLRPGVAGISGTAAAILYLQPSQLGPSPRLASPTSSQIPLTHPRKPAASPAAGFLFFWPPGAACFSSGQSRLPLALGWAVWGCCIQLEEVATKGTAGMMKSLAFSLGSGLLALVFAATANGAGLYHEVFTPPSKRSGELQLGVTWTLWVPDGADKLRGIIVHQHGCGSASACKGGRPLPTICTGRRWRRLVELRPARPLLPAGRQAGLSIVVRSPQRLGQGLPRRAG